MKNELFLMTFYRNLNHDQRYDFILFDTTEKYIKLIAIVSGNKIKNIKCTYLPTLI